MSVSKFLKVDQNVLLEYIYNNNDNFLMENYRIVIDTLSNTRAFTNSEQTNSQNSISNNTTSQNLFLLDEVSKKWGILDPNVNTNKYSFIQYQNFPGNVPFLYDTIKLHFPINYTFGDNLGVLLNVYLKNSLQTINFPITNYFYDKTDPSRIDLDLTTPPFLFNEQLWGKNITINIPSPYALVNDVTINQGVRLPRPSTIHYNLVGNTLNVLSAETPIFIDFQFLTKQNNILNQKSYFVSNPFSTSIPVIAEFQSLGVQIKSSILGDYFEISGTFNNNISDFDTFIQNGELMGKSYYVIYNITTFEKNVQTGTLSISQMSNFDIPVNFRPIIKYSTTTAVIEVQMSVINSVDNSTISRLATYSMLQNEVAKYSNNLTKLNVRDTYNPKIYNAKPNNLMVQANSSLTTNTTKVNVPYAISYERINIQVKDISSTVNSTTYYGQSQQQILLFPSNNIFKFAVISSVNNNGVVPYSFSTASPVFLRFTGKNTTLDIPLYYDSNEVDLANGIVVFNILESMYSMLTTIAQTNTQFYIIYKAANGINTTIYFGTFLLSTNF